MRIPQQHKFTLGYANKYNLRLNKFNNDPFRYRMHNKTLKSSSDFKELRFFLDEFNVNAEDKLTSAGKIMHKALQEPMQDFARLSWNEILQKYDKYSLRSWLFDRAHLKADTIDYISLFYNIEAFLDSGLVEILID